MTMQLETPPIFQKGSSPADPMDLGYLDEILVLSTNTDIEIVSKRRKLSLPGIS
jgi:hypothetical protein